MDVHRFHGAAGHCADCGGHSLLGILCHLGDGVAVCHRQVDIQHQTGLGHFDLYALGVLLSTLLIGHQIRNAGTQIPHHAGNAFHLPDGAHRDGGDDLLRNVDASLLVGKRHITLIFSHCDSPFCILAANFISNVLFYHAIPKITTANLMP